MKISYVVIVGLAILILIYGISSFIVLDINTKEMKNTEISKNVALSTALMVDFDQFVKKRIDVFKDITKIPQIQQTLYSSNKDFRQLVDVEDFLNRQEQSLQQKQPTPFIKVDTSTLSDELKDIIEFFDRIYEHDVIEELFITNQYGANIALGVGTSDYRQDDEEWWQKTKNEGTFIGKPIYSENYQAYSIPVGLRISDESGNFLGVMRVLINLEDLLSDLQDDSEILTSENKSVIIVDEDGTILFSSKSEQFFLDDYENFENLDGRLGSFEITNSDSSRFVAYSASTGYLDFPGFGWFVVIEQEESSVLQDISDVRNEMTGIMMVTVLVAIIIGVVVIYSISRPLKKITHIASQFSKGNVEYRQESSVFSEFQIVLESFRKASKSLKQLIETEKELAESQAKVKNERLTVMGELSSSLAHDLKNPLAVIKTGIDAIKKNSENLSPQFKEEVFPRMENSIKRMSHQIEDVLNYVRITPTNLKTHSLLTILHSAMESLQIPKNIEIILPQKDIPIYCDRQKIEVVFINMILNSIQAIGEQKGNIVISASQKQNEYTIEVKDDGEGIPDDKINQIFKPLFTTKMKGTGLGLSICKNIIEQHGWTINAKNNPTRFIIKINKEKLNNRNESEMRN